MMTYRPYGFWGIYSFAEEDIDDQDIKENLKLQNFFKISGQTIFKFS